MPFIGVWFCYERGIILRRQVGQGSLKSSAKIVKIFEICKFLGRKYYKKCKKVIFSEGVVKMTKNGSKKAFTNETNYTNVVRSIMSER